MKGLHDSYHEGLFLLVYPRQTYLHKQPIQVAKVIVPINY